MQSEGIMDVPPEQLRETMRAVLTSIQQSGALSSECNNLVQEVVSSGAFKGDAAKAAVATVVQIDEDMQKILQHGTALAEHLGKTADVVLEGEGQSVSKLHAVTSNGSSILGT